MRKIITTVIIVCSFFTAYAQYFADIQTDKAQYSPSDTVLFSLTLNKSVDSGTEIVVKYIHLAEVTGTEKINASAVTGNKLTWKWIPPTDDFKGYLVEIVLQKDESIIEQINTAVDVSSSWSYFPRYGFLSIFSELSDGQVAYVIGSLNRYHMNGLQFYDWHYKHNMPLKGTVENPAETWKDIANRTIYLSTINKYISVAHSKGMKAMAYNLLYGAYSNSYQDGVKDEWALYMDPGRVKRYMYDLPSGWASDLYFMNPANTEWQDYILAQMQKVFQAIPFDGWHVDQVGDPGTVYDYNGNAVKVNEGFRPFLEKAKEYLKVPLVMNAVNQYGARDIAQSPVDFLYSEVWDPNNTYADLVKIINNNSTYSSGKLNTVLPAYMDYGIADNPGFFNTPGVLLTEAVIFAAGGSHIELGEHMLGKEYFPNGNLYMKEDLKKNLVNYYDFLVAYENLLRDSINYKSILVASENYSITATQHAGSIWQFAKEKGNKDIIHLINFINASSLKWNDAQGTQPEPNLITNLPLTVTVSSPVKNVWLASPDSNMGSPVVLSFKQDGDKLTVNVPYLKYWSMIVIEYDSQTSVGYEESGKKIKKFSLEQNYPNPFNPVTNISFLTAIEGHVSLKLYDLLGKEIAALIDEDLPAGAYNLPLSSEKYALASGVYFYRLTAPGFTSTKKCILNK